MLGTSLPRSDLILKKEDIISVLETQSPTLLVPVEQFAEFSLAENVQTEQRHLSWIGHPVDE